MTEETTGPEPELHALLRQAHALLGQATERTEHAVTPAWRRVTEGEPRWPVSVAVLVMIALQFGLPPELHVGPVWLGPAVELVLLVTLMAANPGRVNRDHPGLRALGIALIVVATAANADSVAHLVSGLVAGTFGSQSRPLLLDGASIWLTNVIVFALWYWESDRGGPSARAHARSRYPDFLFPQMSDPAPADPEWEPGFVDYLYVSFTNAAAFSPTDTMPLSRWAKLTMLLQSSVSLVTVALVIARAVNILA